MSINNIIISVTRYIVTVECLHSDMWLLVISYFDLVYSNEQYIVHCIVCPQQLIMNNEE